MSNEQLFIAPKIKVGFQKRSDTYTEMLAYVIYYDMKGVLRKEKSWESWRDKKIEPVEFDNVPTEGFVLNKKVGGKGWSSWDTRQEYVRVYDPRNFEFEITVPNLLFILKECDCSKGKGLEGKFVYAWSGTTLVLLPESSEEYKRSASYTGLQAKTIPVKSLVKGAAYLTKKQEKWIYIDKRLRYNVGVTSWRDVAHVDLTHVFWDDNDKIFVFQRDTKKLAAVISETADASYAGLVEMYDKSVHGSPPVRLFTQEQPLPVHDPNRYWYGHPWAKEKSPGVFSQYESHFSNGSVDRITKTYEVSLREVTTPVGKGTKYLDFNRIYHCWYSDRYRNGPGDSLAGITPVDQGLYVELASGSVFKVTGSGLTQIGEANGKDG